MTANGCFYCDHPMLRMGATSRGGRRQHPHSATLEHIVPQAKVANGDYPRTREWDRLNAVRACFTCNNKKGGMWPLDWIIVMPEAGVSRLAKRLAELGCEQAAIDAAIAQRPA